MVLAVTANDVPSHAIVTIGRMNPPTIGHKLMIDKILRTAEETGSAHYIFLTHTQDKKRNPLLPEDKLEAIRAEFPYANVILSPDVKTPTDAFRSVSRAGHRSMTVVTGPENVEAFKNIAAYNKSKSDPDFDPSKHFGFDSIEVIPSGNRNDEATDITGVSATKLRQAAKDEDYPSFESSFISPKYAKQTYTKVRQGMKLEDYYAGQFKAVFLLGGPGSGKDRLIRECFSGVLEISLDQLAHYISEGSNHPKLDDYPAIVVNGSASKPFEIFLCKSVLESMNYETSCVYVDVDNKTSSRRCSQRLDESVRKAKLIKSNETLIECSKTFSAFQVFPNSDDITEEQSMYWASELREGIEAFYNAIPINSEVVSYLQEKIEYLDKKTPTQQQVQKKFKLTSKKMAVIMKDAKKHEKEHTSSDKIAKEIALDHLKGDPKYYQKLSKVEKK